MCAERETESWMLVLHFIDLYSNFAEVLSLGHDWDHVGGARTPEKAASMRSARREESYSKSPEPESTSRARPRQPTRQPSTP